MTDPQTEELRVEQVLRERHERAAASDAPLGEEAEQHDRRAQRAAYLKAKLDERAASEAEAAD